MDAKPSGIELATIFQRDRASLDAANQDVDFLWKLLIDEVAEAEEVLTDPEKLIYEMADIIIFASHIIDIVGRNPDEVVREKVGRNNLKFPAVGYSNGVPYEAQHKKNKRKWKEMNGDEEFFA